MKNSTFYADGMDIEDYGFHLLAGYQHPLAGDTNDIIMQLPGMNGAYDYGSTLGPIPFELPIATVQKSALEIQRAYRRLKSLLLDEFGKPKTFKLIFSYEPDKYYNVRYSGSLPTEREFARIGRVTLPLVCYDGHAWSAATNTNVTWGNEEITFNNDVYTLGHSGDGAKTFTEPGSTFVSVSGDTVKPIISISGSGRSVTVSWGDKWFSIGSFTNVDWLIDMKEFVVLKDGQLALGAMTGDWLDMSLVNGTNEIKVTGSQMDFHISFEFHDRFN